MLTQLSFLVKFLGDYGLQCCNYCHLPRVFSFKFESAMTIFHHKFLTRVGRVFANGWTHPSCMTIFIRLFIISVIRKVIKWHIISCDTKDHIQCSFCSHNRTLYPSHDQPWSPKAYCHHPGCSLCLVRILYSSSRPACHSHGVDKTNPHYTEGVYNIPQLTNFIKRWWELTLIQMAPLIIIVSQIRSITTWQYLFMNPRQPGQ